MINLKGINSETVTGILVLTVALINAVLQIFGIKTLPLTDGEVSELGSAVLLIAATLYNVWKNRNITSASQKAQEVADAIKAGRLFIEEVDILLDKSLE